MKGIARFSDEWIEMVKSSADIIEVIGRKVELKQTGRNFVGLCPFHDERTPSFSVNVERQFYHCFGCQRGGNVINFVMETEHLSFPEAVTKLAQERGIPVPTLSVQDEAREKRREKLREINQLAARFYYRQLRSTDGKKAQDYLQTRGITQKLARDFYLGYSPPSWDGLVRHLAAQEIDLTLAQAAGLITQGSQGYIDYFRDRIMFPICDHLGRFIGFGGRSIGSGQPKYLNTSETEVFNKSYTLYGLNWSKDEIKNEDEAIIVEGYTDLIALFGAGKKNVVASLGTAFSPQHARLLKRFTSQVVMAFDGDTAGHRATLRGMETLQENGLTVRVASLSDGLDPDTFVQSSTKQEVDNWLLLAKPFQEYQIDRIISQHDVETREGKLGASNELVSILGKIDNAIERDEYIRYGAQRLGVKGSSLAADVGKWQGIDSQKPVQNRRVTQTMPRDNFLDSSGTELVERELMRYLLSNLDRLGELQEKGIGAHDFLNPDYGHLFVLLSQNQSDEQGTAVANRLYALPEPTASWEEYLGSFLLSLKKRRLENIEEKLSSLENDRKGFDTQMELYRLLKEYYDILSTKL